jgi:hypothetical protein
VVVLVAVNDQGRPVPIRHAPSIVEGPEPAGHQPSTTNHQP